MSRSRIVRSETAFEELSSEVCSSFNSSPGTPSISSPSSTAESKSVPIVYHNDSLNKRMKHWQHVIVPENGILSQDAFPQGFVFSVFDGQFTQHFDIPSEEVNPTHGAMRYIEHYNEVGPYSRFRFQICHSHLQQRCQKGMECTYIHANRLPSADVIHARGREKNYDTLQSGSILFIYSPHSSMPPQAIPSQSIIRTVGAEKLMHAISQGSTSFHRPQHCAHLQFKKVCNRGYNCGFIHSIAPPAY